MPKQVGWLVGDTRELMGPNFIGVGFVGVDVDHPIENLREPAAAGLLAGILGGD